MLETCFTSSAPEPRHLDAVVTVLLLPAFFAFTGMRTRIDLVSGMDQWVICGLIVSAVSFAIFEGVGAAYYLLAGVLVGNIWEAWRRWHYGSRRLRRRGALEPAPHQT